MSQANDDLKALRQQVDEILEKAKADLDYRRALLDAPQDTLEAEGLPAWAVDQLVFNEWCLADVSGHALREYTTPPCGTQAPPKQCDLGTCWFGVSKYECMFSGFL